MEISIDRYSPLPIRDQITGQIRLLIDSGRLRPGDSLPTIKTAAVQSGVNANTVAAAYRVLEEEGYLTQRKRAGTTVAKYPPRHLAAILTERLGAEAASKARAAGVDPNELLRAVAAHGALAGATPELRVAVLAATELQARTLAARTEAILGDGVACLPLTPERYDSQEYHLTIIDPALTDRLHSRRTDTGERPSPTYLRYGPEFPAGAD